MTLTKNTLHAGSVGALRTSYYELTADPAKTYTVALSNASGGYTITVRPTDTGSTVCGPDSLASEGFTCADITGETKITIEVTSDEGATYDLTVFEI